MSYADTLALCQQWKFAEEKRKTAGFQLGKEKSLWLRKLFYVPGNNRVSMNVILGCKGLKDCFPQLSDLVYVEISDFIDISYAYKTVLCSLRESLYLKMLYHKLLNYLHLFASLTYVST